MINLDRWIWPVPFICFLFGYYIISWFFSVEMVTLPEISGRKIQDAVSILVPYKINLRILGEVDDTSVPEGTILSQWPVAGKKVKVFQSVGVLVSKSPDPILAPNFTGGLISDVKKEAKKKGIALSVYSFFTEKYPKNWCFAQSVPFGEELPDSEISVYVSDGEFPVRIMPDLYGKKILDLDISQYGDLVSVKSLDGCDISGCKDCKIISQKPLAGSFVDFKFPARFKFLVKHLG